MLPVNPASAQSQDGADAGSATLSEDLFKQGVALVYDSNRVTDATLRGLDLLQKSADQGNTAALLELGSLHLFGTVIPTDWAKARTYYDMAAEAGDWSGIAQYGMMLMWTERNWKAGQDLLEAAGEKGVTSAWVTLAEGAMYGYLGGGSQSRAKYESYAEKARQAGEPKIEVLEAARYQWGISVRADGVKAIEVLQKAADAGNAEAALALVNLLRDGNGQNVSRNRASARAVLSAYEPLFSEIQRWQLQKSIEAAEANDMAEFAALSEDILSNGTLVTRDLGFLLTKANLNAAIYVVQAKLGRMGYDVGVPDGRATRRTLAAMYDACNLVASPASCDDSVMRQDVISALLTMN